MFGTVDMMTGHSKVNHVTLRQTQTYSTVQPHAFGTEW